MLAIVTGATGGLGLETALGLARAGHEVLVTGRNAERVALALAQVQAVGRARFAALDVASLASVRAFAAALDEPVGVLVNNAGVMALPTREVTEDGFERQLATNYLGHFALTALLLSRLRGGRVVNVSSLAHRRGRIAFEDLQGERSYAPWDAYGQSKLAMLMFGLELQRRSVEHGWGVAGLAAHPGWARSRIVINGKRPGLVGRVMQAGFDAFAQSTADGALPLLAAALDPAVQPGSYTGPCCMAETRGRPAPSRIMPQADILADRARLWEASEHLTGVTFS